MHDDLQTLETRENTALSDAIARRLAAVGFDDDDAKRDAEKKRIDAIHVNDPTWKTAKEIFERLVKRSASPSLPGICMIIKGPSGAGKSHTVRGLLKHKKMKPKRTKHGPLRPMLYIETPPGAGPGELASSIVEAITGAPLPKGLTVKQAWDAAYRHMQSAGTAILFFDEFHHVFSIYDKAKRLQIVNRIKAALIPHLSEDHTLKVKLPVQVVLAGLPVISDIVVFDSQTSERHEDFEIRPLPQTASGRRLMQQYIAAVETELDFPVPCNLATDDMIFRFMKATAGYTGRAMRFIKSAAFNAVDAGATSFGREELGYVLQTAYGLHPNRNPFLVEDISKCAVFRPVEIEIPTEEPGNAE